MKTKLDIEKDVREAIASPDTSTKTVLEYSGFLDDVLVDDGGMSISAEIGVKDMFVRLLSWSDAKEHSDIMKFVGRHIRITIETSDKW